MAFLFFKQEYRYDTGGRKMGENNKEILNEPTRDVIEQADMILQEAINAELKKMPERKQPKQLTRQMK